MNFTSHPGTKQEQKDKIFTWGLLAKSVECVLLQENVIGKKF